MQQSHAKLRHEALAALGGRCTRCGEADCRLLQIDHVNGDAVEERKRFGVRTLGVGRMLALVAFREWFYEHLERYMLLCANCHILKGLEQDDQQRSKRKYTTPVSCSSLEVA